MITVIGSFWLSVNALGVMACTYILYDVFLSYLDLEKRGRNGKEKAILWQQIKVQSSSTLSHISVGIAPLVDTTSSEFIFFVFFSFTYKAYVSFSQLQFNKLLQALVRENTNSHKFPFVVKEIDTLQSRIKELEEMLESLPLAQTSIIESPVVEPRMIIVGIWSQSRKFRLNLEEDLFTFLDSGGSWDYIPITESVATDAVEARFNDISKPIDLVYYAGHSDERGLIFEDELVRPRWFADLLQLNKVGLVILSSCKGRNVAKALSRSKIPVIFIQSSIADETAIRATAALVGALADGYTLQYSVHRARLSLKKIHLIDYFGDDNFRLCGTGGVK